MASPFVGYGAWFQCAHRAFELLTYHWIFVFGKFHEMKNSSLSGLCLSCSCWSASVPVSGGLKKGVLGRTLRSRSAKESLLILYGSAIRRRPMFSMRSSSSMMKMRLSISSRSTLMRSLNRWAVITHVLSMLIRFFLILAPWSHPKERAEKSARRLMWVSGRQGVRGQVKWKCPRR